MPLRTSLFAVSGKGTFIDARRNMSGLFVCDTTTMLPVAGILDRSQDNLVTGNAASLSVTVHPFNAVLNRIGALLIQNDGNVTVMLEAAPSANSRIDVVYVKQNETRPPISDKSDAPTLGVAKGVASAVPVPPSVPEGALALAQVLLPAGVSNTVGAGVVITQTYMGAAVKGGMLRAQTASQRNALTTVADGTLLHDVSDGCDYVMKAGKWHGWSMPRRDIHSGTHSVTMWASGGVAHISLLSAPVNLTSWGSTATVGQVSNAAFRPSANVSTYAATRDGYFPTTATVLADGSVTVGYNGGPTGNRTVSTVISYDIG